MVSEDNKAIQIRFFFDTAIANDFMVDQEVVDVKFDFTPGYPKSIMVIYKKYIREEV